MLSFQVFKIDREGEYQRYRPFKDLPNRQLLWHGSRTTNYAGILSQGLRIAPPEAPVVCTNVLQLHLLLIHSNYNYKPLTNLVVGA